MTTIQLTCRLSPDQLEPFEEAYRNVTGVSLSVDKAMTAMSEHLSGRGTMVVFRGSELPEILAGINANLEELGELVRLPESPENLSPEQRQQVLNLAVSLRWKNYSVEDGLDCEWRNKLRGIPLTDVSARMFAIRREAWAKQAQETTLDPGPYTRSRPANETLERHSFLGVGLRTVEKTQPQWVTWGNPNEGRDCTWWAAEETTNVLADFFGVNTQVIDDLDEMNRTSRNARIMGQFLVNQPMPAQIG